MARNQNGSNGGVTSAVLASVATAVAAADQARQNAVTQLTERRDEIQAELDQITEQLETLEGTPARGRRGGARRSSGTRARNDVTLEFACATALKGGKTMSPAEIAAAVQSAGYKSSSPNFTGMVSQALLRLEGQRMSRAAIVSNPNHGEWVAGAGLAAYLADPDKATAAPAK